MKILALLLMMRKITLEVKFDKKYVHLFKIYLEVKGQCGALVESQVGDPEDIGSRPTSVKRKIMLVLFFREALRHICVTAGA